jgi:hypothetical protein
MVPPETGPGISLDMAGRYYPTVFGLDEDYLAVEGAATGWLYFGRFSPALGVRIGGQKNFGDAPYYDAAYIGGHQLRGLPINRFAGDTSLHANVGLLVSLAKIRLVVPGHVGLMVQAGAGRVWLEGEDSDAWHHSYGGGLWWAPWTMTNAVRLAFAQSDHGATLYVLTGFGF